MVNNGEIDAHRAALLGAELARNTTIQVLSLKMPDLDTVPDFGSALRDGLASNVTLRQLNLKGAPIGRGAMRAMEESRLKAQVAGESNESKGCSAHPDEPKPPTAAEIRFVDAMMDAMAGVWGAWGPSGCGRGWCLCGDDGE